MATSWQQIADEYTVVSDDPEIVNYVGGLPLPTERLNVEQQLALPSAIPESYDGNTNTIRARMPRAAYKEIVGRTFRRDPENA